jgi:hypothetical protein
MAMSRRNGSKTGFPCVSSATSSTLKTTDTAGLPPLAQSSTAPQFLVRYGQLSEVHSPDDTEHLASCTMPCTKIRTVIRAWTSTACFVAPAAIVEWAWLRPESSISESDSEVDLLIEGNAAPKRRLGTEKNTPLDEVDWARLDGGDRVYYDYLSRRYFVNPVGRHGLILIKEIEKDFTPRFD